MNLKHRVALVTGASSGVAQATAEWLATAGVLDAGVRRDLGLEAQP